MTTKLNGGATFRTEAVKRYARLKTELDALRTLFPDIEVVEVEEQAPAPRPKGGRRSLTDAEKKAISVRMKKRWAKIKKGQAT